MRGNSLVVAVFAFILLVISGFLIIRGIGEYAKDKELSRKEAVVDEKETTVNEEVELSEFYEVGFESESPDSYSRNDPFREVCSQVDLEEGTTVVYSNVVCFK